MLGIISPTSGLNAILSAVLVELGWCQHRQYHFGDGCGLLDGLPAAVPAKKANSGIAEPAFETNCRSAPVLFLGESAPVLFLKCLTNTVALGSAPSPNSE